jgi:hypothetical protein
LLNLFVSVAPNKLGRPVELLGDYKQRASPDYLEAVGGAVRLKGVRLSSVHPFLHTKLD